MQALPQQQPAAAAFTLAYIDPPALMVDRLQGPVVNCSCPALNPVMEGVQYCGACFLSVATLQAITVTELGLGVERSRQYRQNSLQRQTHVV